MDSFLRGVFGFNHRGVRHSEGCLMGNSCGTGWRALVKTAKEAAQNKNDKEMYRAQGLKKDVIDKRKTIAGYYL